MTHHEIRLSGSRSHFTWIYITLTV